jgi:hypothetical protein
VKAPKWRLAAGVVILAALAAFAVAVLPLYYRNYQFQQFVSAAASRAENRNKSDDVLREWLLDKADSLKLPVKAGDVHIQRSPDGLHIDVRYAVRVDFPGYTVNLHFYPAAGTM